MLLGWNAAWLDGNSSGSASEAGRGRSSVGIVSDIPFSCPCVYSSSSRLNGGGGTQCVVGSVADALVSAVCRTRFARGIVSESLSGSEERTKSSNESGEVDFCFFFPFPPVVLLEELDC